MNPENFLFIQKTSPADNTSVISTHKINHALLNMAYKQLPFGLLASFCCAILVLLGLYTPETKQTLALWFGFLVIVNMVRAVLARAYFLHHNHQVKTNIAQWQSLFIVGGLLGGVCWGLAGVYLFPLYDSAYQTLIVIVIAGMTAGAIPNLAGVRMASVAFLLASILPLISYLIIQHHTIDLIFAATLTIYVCYMVVLTYKIHNTLRNSLSLQFQNDILLKNLSLAKTELECINKKLEEAATHDPLTHVANRNLFVENFSKAISLSEQNHKMAALLYLDLDNFKSVNDYHGHHIGDRLLLAIVARLEQICKQTDVISRLGGDEFTIILDNISHTQEVEKIARRICKALSAPINIGSVDVEVGVSIGVSIYPLDSTDPEELLNTADQAMYYVKQHGGNNFRFNVELITHE